MRRTHTAAFLIDVRKVKLRLFRKTRPHMYIKCAFTIYSGNSFIKIKNVKSHCVRVCVYINKNVFHRNTAPSLVMVHFIGSSIKNIYVERGRGIRDHVTPDHPRGGGVKKGRLSSLFLCYTTEPHKQ